MSVSYDCLIPSFWSYLKAVATFLGKLPRLQVVERAYSPWGLSIPQTADIIHALGEEQERR